MKKELIDGEVTQEEIDQARELWIKEGQRSVYDDKNFDQVQVSLSLFTDDKGILMCGGRDSCGALERSNDYFHDEMVKFEVQ